MDHSQIQPTQDPHNDGLHTEGEQQPKKSLLHKVKGKARKIKKSILKRDHADDGQHDQDHSPRDGGSEESYEEDSDEGMDEPEIHGAPIYDSPAVTGATAGKGGNTGDHGVNYGKKEDALFSTPLPTSIPPVSYGEKEDVLDSTPRMPTSTPPVSRYASEEVQGLLGKPTTLHEDPNSLNSSHGSNPANYQSKVIDPTGAGAEEVKLSPIVESFGKLSVDDDRERKSYLTPRAAGTHDDDLTSELSPTKSPQSSPTATGGSYTDKLISAKNAVASKFGYGGGATTPAAETKLGDDNYAPVAEKEGEPKGYVAGVTEKLSPVYSKVASTGTALLSKVPGTGAGKSSTETETNTPMKTDAPIEAHSGANKGYAAAMTERLAPVYNKVAGAGTTILSKVPGTGAGSPTSKTKTETGVERDIGVGTEKGAANKGYAAGVTEKLSPVYNKVSSAGTTIFSKFTGSGAAGAGTEGASDKGVSVTDNLYEKTKPGEEHKALSDTIQEALYLKSKPSGEGKPLVKESDEVARQLGTGDELNSGHGTGELKMNSGGNTGGVVDTVKHWFGKGNEDGVGSSPKGGTAHEAVGERRLQESSN